MFELSFIGLYLFTLLLKSEVRRKPRNRIDLFVDEFSSFYFGFIAAKYFLKKLNLRGFSIFFVYKKSF